jgi:hypothetical protein
LDVAHFTFIRQPLLLFFMKSNIVSVQHFGTLLILLQQSYSLTAEKCYFSPVRFRTTITNSYRGLQLKRVFVEHVTCPARPISFIIGIQRTGQTSKVTVYRCSSRRRKQTPRFVEVQQPVDIFSFSHLSNGPQKLTEKDVEVIEQYGSQSVFIPG